MIHLGDCLEVLKTLPDNSVEAVVTDPPYGLKFMSKKWDCDVPSVEIWKECLRVLKHGGYLLAFAGTRTQHRMAVNIEDAGFEIRDMIAWVYGNGFPKSFNIGKAVDKLQGNEREVVGKIAQPGSTNKRTAMGDGWQEEPDLTKGNSEWEGWGTALKPAFEPITVARKPLSEKTVAKNCLKWGTGGLNIDACRVGSEEMRKTQSDGTFKSINNSLSGFNTGRKDAGISIGRFPANLISDGSDEVVRLFPNDSQRFFYCAKASKSERNRGCERLEDKANSGCYRFREDGGLDGKPTQPKINFHPTVKPVALMEYLVKLVSREGATILDPFMGSGTTGIACVNLRREFVGIEKEAEYFEIAKARIEAAQAAKQETLNL